MAKDLSEKYEDDMDATIRRVKAYLKALSSTIDDIDRNAPAPGPRARQIADVIDGIPRLAGERQHLLDLVTPGALPEYAGLGRAGSTDI